MLKSACKFLQNRIGFSCRFSVSPVYQIFNQHYFGSMSRVSNGYCDGLGSIGIIIIGDEILKGTTVDTNSGFMCQFLHSVGAKVQKISIIPDDIDVISNEVRQFASRYSHVITAGGVGPTHDDVTFAGIAAAFGTELRERPEMLNAAKEYVTGIPPEALAKLCQIPADAQLLWFEDPALKRPLRFPLVKLHNVFVFPGIPRLLESVFPLVAREHFARPERLPATRTLYSASDEFSCVPAINTVVREFPLLTVGSYPEWDNNYYRLKLTLEASTPSLIDQAVDRFHQLLPSDSLLDQFDPAPLEECQAKINKLHGRIGHLRDSLRAIGDGLDRYSGPAQLCISFNGGKDCTVLLHLIHVVVRSRKSSSPSPPLLALYISDRNRSPTRFDAIDRFVRSSADRYGLKVVQYDSVGGFRPAIRNFLAEYPSVRAVFMGTRLTDPSTQGLQPFSPTDAGWPELMRINPLLHWSYSDVWTLLRRLSLPYCRLYDQGYTSLGFSPEDSRPNARLAYTDGGGRTRYRPAWMLDDAGAERMGRVGAGVGEGSGGAKPNSAL